MRRQSWAAPRVLAVTHKGGSHRDFTVCSCSLLPVLLPGGVGASRKPTCSTTADVSGEPVMRSALVKARRRIACCTHCGEGCSHAPRPGRLPAVSTITACLPFPSDSATTRSSSAANSRFRHPTHVRTGPSVHLCAQLVRGAEGSRWITAQSSVTEQAVRTTRRCGLCRQRSCAIPLVAPGSGWPADWPGESPRMSIRHPVSRAASLAFCPSLPMASDS